MAKAYGESKMKGNSGTKKPPLGGYDITAYCFDFIRFLIGTKYGARGGT